MANNVPMKSLSFDSRVGEEKMNKNDVPKAKSYSFASRTNTNFNLELTDSINESNKEPPEISLDQLTQEIGFFVESLSSKVADVDVDVDVDADHSSQQSSEIPIVVIQFLKKLDSMIQKYESTSEGEKPFVFGQNADKDPLFIAAITRLSSLIEVLDRCFKSDDTMPLINQATVILHHAMVIFEYELRYLLEEEPVNDEWNPKKDEHSKDVKDQEAEGNSKKTTEENVDKEEKNSINFPPFSSETINSIRMISRAMIVSGYDVECWNVFIISRRQMFEEELKKQGFEKMSVDDVHKMNWESLEGVITTWIRCFKYCSTTLFPGEHKFYESVFQGHTSPKSRLLAHLSSAVFTLLVNFAEAVSLSKRSTEKLFKFLDMYETLRDMSQLMANKDESIYPDNERIEDLKVEFTNAECRLGESAVSIFCQLENSIKNDHAKTPVPNGAVHPLTRYTMNYLKYACEYKQTLEQVFQNHLRNEHDQHHQQQKGGDESKKPNKEAEKHSPFATQLLTVMELLDANLEAKSKLYKDQSLKFIFLMNNGRYMLQKVKGTPEIHQVVGDNWCRKRSSDVRQCHKGYQRETWSKVLQCLNQEGLQVHGKIQKPVLKERFNNFNKLLEEIHKTQSAWIVSDEQLQSELRVSISAVMIPAYRSFLGRFGQIFTPGRQVEKYIKYQPDDIENVIEELFDGNQQNMSMARRR